MGIDIDQVEFSPQDFATFSARLEQNLDALDLTLAGPDFGLGPGSLGAELEMYIVDASGKPLYVNQEIQADANDPQLTLELNRYNLEYNLTPQALARSPFISTEEEILAKLSALSAVAARHGGRIVPIGILPTLTPADFGAHCITDKKRYRALVSQLIARRGSRFQIDINGPKQIGSGKQLSIADKIASHYEAGGGHIEDNQPVHWLGSFASPMLILEGYQKIALSVRYYARTTRGQ